MIPLLLVLAVTTSTPDSLLARAGFNRSAWETALERLGGVDQERCVWLLGELSELDLMEVDEATILGHVEGCSRAVAARPDYVIPEDTLRTFVLHPLTGYYDMLTDWRTELFGIFHEQCTGTVEADVETVIAYLRDTVRIHSRTDLFGPPSPPAATLRRGWGSDGEWASLAVAGLRSIGIAARLASEGKGGEAWDGRRWIRAFTAVDEAESPHGTDAQEGRLELRISADGQPWRNTEQMGLARWSRGAWRPVEPPENPVSADLSDSSIIVTAPPGSYLVTAGVRNARGEPRVFCAETTIRPDSLSQHAVDLSIPFDEMDRRDLVQAPEPSLTGVTFVGPSGATVWLNDMIGSGRPVFLCAVQPGDERSERLLDALDGQRHALEAMNAAVIVAGRDGGHGLCGDPTGSLWDALGLETGTGLPVVILLSPDGSVVVCQRGASPHAIDLVMQSLRVFRLQD